MQLKELRVQNFRSIEDSGWVAINDLSCLIGKNESGKTSFMKAVEKLNPRYGPADYTPYKQYPRRRWTRYEARHDDDPDVVASAKFTIGEPKKREINQDFTEGILQDNEVILKKFYDNSKQWEMSVDESTYVSYVLSKYDLHHATQNKLEGSNTIEELRRNIRDSDADNEELNQLGDEVQGETVKSVSSMIGESYLAGELPEFQYMGEYSILEDTIGIQDLLGKKQRDELSASDEVFLSLLSVANLDLKELNENPNWERIRTNLESASGYITDEVMKYWTQNQNIRLGFDRNKAEPDGPSKYDSGNIIDITVENLDFRSTIKFNQRSRGFRWFFSSFCHFMDLRDLEQDLILLLDEPGLHLHAKAQQDFLNFLNEELSAEHTVVYSTHSPFMIDPRKLHQAKMVMADPEGGTNISEDVMATDEDTRVPLQNVFEFDLVNTLLIRPQTLLVEGKSDHAFMYAMSELLASEGRETLDRQWTVIPVGSGNNVPTFVSLFGGNDLDLAVLLDGDSSFDQRKDKIKSIDLMQPEHIISTSSFVDNDYSDIEDLFSEQLYMELVNGAYSDEIVKSHASSPIELSDLKDDNRRPRIVKRMEKYFDRQHINEGRFRHHAPAEYFQENIEEYREEIDEETMENFESLFREFNTILKEFE